VGYSIDFWGAILGNCNHITAKNTLCNVSRSEVNVDQCPEARAKAAYLKFLGRCPIDFCQNLLRRISSRMNEQCIDRLEELQQVEKVFVVI